MRHACSLPDVTPLRLAALALLLAATACDGPTLPPDNGLDPAAEPAPAEVPGQLLRDVTTQSGIDFNHEIVLGGSFALPEISTAGCAIFDADGDGRLDVYFTNAGRGPGDGAPNALFRNLGDGTFEDVSAASGLDDGGYGFGVAVGDVDNDGDLDVALGNWGADALYLNDGAGHFTDVTAEAGLRGDQWTTSMAFVDYDLDGFLDLYVVHYVDVDPTKFCAGVDSRREYCTPQAFPATTDTLYRNRGDGTFDDVSIAAGLTGVAGPGLGVNVADFDGDAWPDVLVANDGAANQLWINGRDGTFRDDALLLGIAYDGQGATEASMGVALGDVDGDGRLDVLMTHLNTQANTLYVRRGDRAFTDRSAPSGIGRASRGQTGFGTVMIDIDHDGDLDVAFANGLTERGESVSDTVLVSTWSGYGQRNQLLLNDGAGRFEDATAKAGLFGTHADVSRGLAWGDLDGDGDLDLVVANGRGPGRVHTNLAGGRAWVMVRAVDPDLKRDVYSATIRVAGQVRVVGPASSYLSSSQIPVHFGLADASAVGEIEVVWPGGDTERFDGGAPNRTVVIERGKGRD
jgi:enediyne biosynthesis protein E4